MTKQVVRLAQNPVAEIAFVGEDGRMPQTPPKKRRPATALIAFARALSMEEPVEHDEVDDLVDSVCLDPAERISLVSALQQVNHDELTLVITDLLGRRIARLRERESGLRDLDEVVGVWTQRLSAGALLAAAGATIAGALAGEAAIAALAVPTIGGIAVALGRLRLRRGQAGLCREREETEHLLRYALEALKLR
ncbi:hypothetical protein [Sedimentitalea todarodis]|uniref:Uncharacterized protein n=1 Tax=Sedimentitalea todarodis TaxID=1631240 RepID=A0ABU3V8D9_9RHOB|nr:hypothetical protein [Sedimentitalea todarodis]MDU9002420.1 hypothetical protein [Sedimentitalea todarodis]